MKKWIYIRGKLRGWIPLIRTQNRKEVTWVIMLFPGESALEMILIFIFNKSKREKKKSNHKD